MHLKQIKISGFKSFADPVTIFVPRETAGIVGPNGSGKSNVIDAMRWVVGESSAKSLRGETLDDVIFNGSDQRKPASRASVELLFDNALNRCPGQWAKFSEISIRRTVTRDGISEYFINNTRTRRRDVKELFLGTGFGPRSYSIIEQGMISRIVDGKPEELSAFVEEASGVSRFKEKRHETVLKLNRTQDNLERLDDMRNEVDTRVRQLRHQADQARRYRKLKENAARLRARLLSVQWRECSEQIERTESELSNLDVERNRRLALVRSAEADQETARKSQLEQQARLNELQMEHYRVNAEISNLERQIRELCEETERDEANLLNVRNEISQLHDSVTELEKKQDESAEQFEHHQKRLDEITQALERKTERLTKAESELAGLQGEMEQIDREVIEAIRRRESVVASLEESQRRQTEVDTNLNALEAELRQLEADNESHSTVQLQIDFDQLSVASQSLAEEIGELESTLAGKRSEYDQLVDELEQLRDSSQESQVRLKTLTQRLLESQSTEEVGEWLTDNGLDQAPVLSARVEVADGWERAVDRVMGDWMAAVVVDDVGQLARQSKDSAVSATMYFVDDRSGDVEPKSSLPALAQHVRSSGRMAENMLVGVYVADDLEQGLKMRSKLNANECIVTAEGAVLGFNWYSPAVGKEAPTGVMETTRLIRECRKQVETDEQNQAIKRQEIEKTRAAIIKLESSIGRQRLSLTEKNDQLADTRGELREIESDRIRVSERRDQIRSRIRRLKESRSELSEGLSALRQQMVEVSDACDRHEAGKVEKSQQIRQQQSTMRELQDRVSEAVAQRHQTELDAQRHNADRELYKSSISDHLQRLDSAQAKCRELENSLASTDDPVAPLQSRLEELVVQSRQCEEKLSGGRSEAEATEVNYRRIDEIRLQHQLSVEEVNTRMQDIKIEMSQFVAQVNELGQKIGELGTSPEQELEQLGEEFDVETSVLKLEKLQRRIENAGAVNLIAVEQYEEEKQRKEYMDHQHDDLTRAIETLRATIQKIDTESREQYTEMFNLVNSEYQRLLPLLFGGGSGHLELLGEYPENAGLRIFARPKGKRVHNIQALSGGEKALTAVALILAFFRINPSPVCLLDEIDAPLDDENVYRLCSSLRDLAETTQLVLITHNKITMESVDTLIGVTMPEPNVSRVLSVDLQEAQEFVA